MNPGLGLFACRAQVHARVVSTMDVARQQAAAGAPHGTTVVALQQTGGRGRHGRHWVSARGAGLWCTTLLCPPVDMSLSGLTLMVGGAVLQAVHALGLPDARIKWPNDILVGEGKLAGVLTEQLPTTGDGGAQVLVGVGLNLAPEAPPDLVDSDAVAAQRYVGLNALLPHVTLAQAQQAVLHALEAAYTQWCTEGLAPTLALFARCHALLGLQVRAHNPHGHDTMGVVTGIAADGGLQLLSNGVTVTIYAGEVSRVRPDRDDDSRP